MKNNSSQRDGPVRMPDTLRQLIRQTYTNVAERLSVMNMIDDFLDRLNQQQRYKDARAFLAEQEASIREEAESRRKRQRRATFWIVSRTVITAVALGSKVAYDWIST